MARQKRISPALNEAKKRRDALAGIDPANAAFDLGGGLTKAAYDAQITTVETTLGRYNLLLQQADGLLNTLAQEEKPLKTLNTRMLAGAKGKWGPDSSEYEQAGGTRTSEIKRKPRTPKPTP